MRGLNQVNLIGNLGADPEVRSIANGDRVATLSLATNFTFKNAKGERVTTTEWHRIVVWRGLAEIAEKYLKKGAKLYIGGRIQYKTYLDRAGITRYSTEILAETLTMLDSAASGEDVAQTNTPDGLDGPEGFIPINER